MVKLDSRASHEYWKSFNDPLIYKVVTFMESVENWTIDGNPDVEKLLEELGEELEGPPKFDLTNQADYIKVLSQLKMPRALRLMQAIDTIHPGSAYNLLMYAEEERGEEDHEQVELFLKRNTAFERLRLLARIFAPERFAIIAKALEQEEIDK
jgi:intracellular multiplication protein IcmW